MGTLLAYIFHQAGQLWHQQRQKAAPAVNAIIFSFEHAVATQKSDYSKEQKNTSHLTRMLGLFCDLSEAIKLIWDLHSHHESGLAGLWVQHTDPATRVEPLMAY